MSSIRGSATRGIKRIDLAYVELASSELARDINRDIVLELIRTYQPVGRAELARYSGLQPSTVSAIVEQLLSEKWITEGADTHPGIADAGEEADLSRGGQVEQRSFTLVEGNG